MCQCPYVITRSHVGPYGRRSTCGIVLSQILSHPSCQTIILLHMGCDIGRARKYGDVIDPGRFNHIGRAHTHGEISAPRTQHHNNIEPREHGGEPRGAQETAPCGMTGAHICPYGPIWPRMAICDNRANTALCGHILCRSVNIWSHAHAVIMLGHV